jgi:predicted GNAT superfamily acetyltransferase
MGILIRPLESIDEVHACEALQRRVWAMADDLEVVPLHLLLSVQRNGGLLLGAFDGGQLVGFVFGFVGFTEEGRPKHCSHMMGVDPAYQSEGVGYQLKLAQRAFALEQGLDLVTWTYDPLESRNAYLNIHKLGAICRTYIRDYYGSMSDGLNRGLPSDRFQVEWWVGGNAADSTLSRRSLVISAGVRGNEQPWPLANVTRRTPAGFLEPGELVLDADALAIRVEIPADYQAIKATDPGLALAWRLGTRQIFEFYFSAGFAVVGFASHPVEGGRRSFYLVCKERNR